MSGSLLVCLHCGIVTSHASVTHWVMHALRGQPTRWICQECGGNGIWFKDLPALEKFCESFAESPKRRRAKERARMSKRLRTRILERDGFRCRRCGNGPRDARLVIDHIVPIAKGGLTIDTNLQTLCEPCNIGKADNLPHAHDIRGLVQ